MGLFSWITSDTERSIPCSGSNRETFPVHMITEDGQIFTEKEYKGYGEFGGKDIYVLAAEMNGIKGKDDSETRDLFFKKIWKRGVTNGEKKYTHEDDFANYESPIAAEGGKTANQLRSEGWDSFGEGGEFAYWVSLGYKMPKLVENLPDKKRWAIEWIQLPYPELCPDQGYFYGGDDEDDEDDEW